MRLSVGTTGVVRGTDGVVYCVEGIDGVVRGRVEGVVEGSGGNPDVRGGTCETAGRLREGNCACVAVGV